MDERECVAGLDASNFWHVAKHELLRKVLNDRVVVGGRVLFVGVGTGEELEMFHDYNVEVVDSDEMVISRMPAWVVSHCVSVEKTSLPSGSFDAVVALDVLEHVERDYDAVCEIFRVLRRGGLFILSVPAHEWLYHAYDEHLGHFRRYEREAVVEMLRRAGFERVRTYWWNFFFMPFFVGQRKIFSKQTVYKPLPKMVNQAALSIMRFENALIQRHVRLLWGLSLWAVCEKSVEGAL